jgi:hypothetical protein
MMRLGGDFNFRDRLTKQSESEKQNGKTAYASHAARF